MGCGAWLRLAAGCLLGLGITRIPSSSAAADPGFRGSRQLPCVLETQKIIPLSNEAETIRLNVRLLLSGAASKHVPTPQTGDLPADSVPSFIVQEPSVDILQHTDEDINMLDCKISPYFTADTQIIWPGREIRAQGLDSWFTCTIEHTAGKYTATALLVQPHEDRARQDPGQLLQGIAGQAHVSAVLVVRTRLPTARAALAGSVVLDCAFSTEPRAAVTVQWVLRQRGGHRKLLFSYSSAGGRVEQRARRAEMFLQEIPKGNASLLLRNTSLGDEGTYSCLVSVSSLVGEQTIQLQILEKPTVTVNVHSLSLVEGEQRKLVCDIRNYYPLDIQAQWLREPEATEQVPDVVQNVLTSSHRRSSNGTYSFSRYFLLTAALRDDGRRYTCRVDHPSLQSPIRRSVTVAVREATSAAWLLLPLLGLAVCLAAVLCHLHKVRSTTKPKPY